MLHVTARERDREDDPDHLRDLLHQRLQHPDPEQTNRSAGRLLKDSTLLPAHQVRLG